MVGFRLLRTFESHFLHNPHNQSATLQRSQWALTICTCQIIASKALSSDAPGAQRQLRTHKIPPLPLRCSVSLLSSHLWLLKSNSRNHYGFISADSKEACFAWERVFIYIYIYIHTCYCFPATVLQHFFWQQVDFSIVLACWSMV